MLDPYGTVQIVRPIFYLGPNMAEQESLLLSPHIIAVCFQNVYYGKC